MHTTLYLLFFIMSSADSDKKVRTNSNSCTSRNVENNITKWRKTRDTYNQRWIQETASSIANSLRSSWVRVVLFLSISKIVHRNKEDISRERLSETNLIVFGGSREEFASSETADLTRWLNEGGRVLYLASDTFDMSEAPNTKNFLGKYVCLTQFTAYFF